MPSLVQDFYMIPFKLAEGIICITIAFIILKRRKNHILNRVCSLSLLGWSLYAVLDAILYPLGHFETLYFGKLMINGQEVFVPLITNILRDFAMIFAGILVFGFFYTSLLLRHGEEFATQKKVIATVSILYVVIIIPTLIFDYIIHTDGYVRSYFNLGSITMILVQIGIFLLTISNLIIIYRNATDDIMRQRIRFFLLGSFFIPFGMVYFVFLGALGLQNIAYITGPLGHTIWTLGAFFIYFGVKKY